MSPSRRRLLTILHVLLFAVYFLAGYWSGRRACPPPSVTEQANANLAAQALVGWEETLKVCEAGAEISRVVRRQCDRSR